MLLTILTDFLGVILSIVVKELFSNTKDKVYIDQKIVLDKISNKLSGLNPVNVHLANPIYIKTIEALSDK